MEHEDDDAFATAHVLLRFKLSGSNRVSEVVITPRFGAAGDVVPKLQSALCALGSSSNPFLDHLGGEYDDEDEDANMDSGADALAVPLTKSPLHSHVLHKQARNPKQRQKQQKNQKIMQKMLKKIKNY